MQSNGAASLRDGPTDNFDNAKFYMNDHSVRKCIALSDGYTGPVPDPREFCHASCFVGLARVCPLSATRVCPVSGRRGKISGDGWLHRRFAAHGWCCRRQNCSAKGSASGKDESKALDRVIRLDPENAEAWSWRCHARDNATAADEPACRKAIALGPTAWNFNGLGDVQEHAGEFCAAEDSYTRAVQATTNEALYLRNMARAAIRCGHTGASVAGFEVAEGLDAKAAADPDEDELTKDDLRNDREYLTVAYDRAKQPDKAAVMCTKVHPEWKTCHCELTDSSVKCSNAEGVSSQSKK